MDETPSPLMQLADERLGGKLRDRVEELRSSGQGWRPVAETINREARLSITHEALRQWAIRNGWIVEQVGAA